MFKVDHKGNHIYKMLISEPRDTNDESQFMEFLTAVLEHPSFALVLQVEGEKAFSLEAKKQLGAWFQSNRNTLKEKCFGFIRVKSTVDNQKNEQMKKVMPCFYLECIQEAQALETLQSLSPVL